jgi:hypothetical protein
MFLNVSHAKHDQHTTDGERKAPRDESTYRACWSRFRPSAHLWAAHTLFFYGVKEGLASTISPRGIIEEGAHQVWVEQAGVADQRFELFLAAAEDMRKFAEGFIMPRANTPLVDQGAAWSVPTTFRLPAVTINMPPPPAEAVTEFQSYRARVRVSRTGL